MLGLTKLVSMLGLTKPCLQVMSTPEQRRSRRWFPLSGETREDKGWIQLLKNYFLIKKISRFLFFFLFPRSRSRSPSDARARLPTELTKHFEYSLIEPSNPSLLQVRRVENSLFKLGFLKDVLQDLRLLGFRKS